jgi:hypothetical protein
MGSDGAVIADFDVGLDDGKWPDIDIAAQLGLGADNR